MDEREEDVSSTVNKELNTLRRSKLIDCTLAFIVFSNNIKHSLILLAVQKGKLGFSTFFRAKCCVVFRHIIIKLIRPGLAEGSVAKFLRT